MAAKLNITIQAGSMRRLWCDTCLTSARYEVDLWILGADGLSKLAMAEGCDHCMTGASAPSDKGEQGEA